MPKNNAAKGGNSRKKAKSNREETTKRELIYKEDQQEYGKVTKMLGNGRCNVACFDGVERMCHIRGAMRKRVWINMNDIVLISLRDFQENKADIIYKYMPDEAKRLKMYGEIPKDVNLSKDPNHNADDAALNFDEDENNEDTCFTFDDFEQI